MKNTAKLTLIGLALMLVACTGPSLEKYYVSHQDQEGFVVLNIPASMFVVSSDSLTAEQKSVLGQVDKANVLAFPVNDKNKDVYKTEIEQVQNILKSDQYKLLMQFDSSNKKFKVLYTGDPQSIDEMIVFGASDKDGFGIARILGDNMNPKAIMDMIKSLKDQDNLSLEGFKKLDKLF